MRNKGTEEVGAAKEWAKVDGQFGDCLGELQIITPYCERSPGVILRGERKTQSAALS